MSDNATPKPDAPIQAPTYEEDFLSMRDILKMILRHSGKIALFTILVTVAAGAFFFLQPPAYHGEAVLQVVTAPPKLNEKFDRDLYDSIILSHLEYLKSPVVASRVAKQLNKNGLDVNAHKLKESVRIERLPKTNLIRINAAAKSEDNALLIAGTWMEVYLTIVTESNIQRALFNVRSHIKDRQEEWMDKLAKAEKMRSYAQLLEKDKLITVSKSVDDQELWSKLGDGLDEPTLKKLAGIHLKSQQINEDYGVVIGALLMSEQEAQATIAARDFNRQVLQILEVKATNRISLSAVSAGTNTAVSDAERYVQTLTDARDVVPLGDPAPVSEASGRLTKTAVTFCIALALSCLAAFTTAWLKDPEALA